MHLTSLSHHAAGTNTSCCVCQQQRRHISTYEARIAAGQTGAWPHGFAKRPCHTPYSVLANVMCMQASGIRSGCLIQTMSHTGICWESGQEPAAAWFSHKHNPPQNEILHNHKRVLPMQNRTTILLSCKVECKWWTSWLLCYLAHDSRTIDQESRRTGQQPCPFAPSQRNLWELAAAAA